MHAHRDLELLNATTKPFTVALREKNCKCIYKCIYRRKDRDIYIYKEKWGRAKSRYTVRKSDCQF